MNTIWTEPVVATVRRLAADGRSCPEIAAALKADFGFSVSRRTVACKCRRDGIQTAKSPAYRPPSPKPRKPRTPSLSPVNVPFLPPMPLVREYVPTGRTPVTFLASGDFVCKNFLPDQDRVEAPYRLVCGNPVPLGSRVTFCDACREGMGIHLAGEPRPGDKSLFRFSKVRAT